VLKVICPKCSNGELMLYKEMDASYHYKITKDGKIYKHPVSKQEFDTEKDYLECKNMDCNQYFDYHSDESGKIIKDSIVER
jgi:hypothetical protein